MKITSVETLAVRIPMPFNYGEATAIPAVIAKVKTDAGLEGLGHVMPLYGRQFRSLRSAVEELGDVLLGADPQRPEQAHRRLLTDGNGTGGVGNLAASVLDIAVWDIAGKAAGQPLWRMLGGHRDRVQAYASLRLGREMPAEQLPDMARSLVAQGFRAMKMNLGQTEFSADIARVRSVREAIGPDIKLLADVNFRWTPSYAIRVGNAIEEYGLYWLEDPVPTANLEGLAEVRRAIRTPIACCEALFSLAANRSLFSAHVVDFPMPDLARVGGITPFLKTAHLAEAFGLPVASHLAPEVTSQVLAAVPNSVIAEYVPWAWTLFKGCPALENGDLVMSERPGHGMELDEAFVKEHLVA